MREDPPSVRPSLRSRLGSVLGTLARRSAARHPGQTMVVYTAIFGDIPDRLHRPPRTPGVRYVCFTDRPERFAATGLWELRAPLWSDPDPRRLARHHRTLSRLVAPDADYSIWHDGNIRLIADPWDLADRYLVVGLEIATFRHREGGTRSTADACATS